eukprot:jgi/Mesvir1/27201/Mv07047-RA.1
MGSDSDNDTGSPSKARGSRPQGGRPAVNDRPVGVDGYHFVSNSFQYNDRVLIALLPCLLVVLGGGGSLVMGTMLVGLMVSYILDALQYREGAFVGVWGTLALVSLSMLLSGNAFSGGGWSRPWPLGLMIQITTAEVLFLAGAWSSLQFRWLQVQYPGVVMAFERLLFATLPIVGAVVQTWGAVAAFGIANAPFYLLASLALLFWLFSTPTRSSFVSDAGSVPAVPAVPGVPPTSSQPPRHKPYPKDAYICTPLDHRMHTFAVMVFPAAFYLGVHYPSLLGWLLPQAAGGAPGVAPVAAVPGTPLFSSLWWADAWSFLLLCSLPMLFLAFMSRRGAPLPSFLGGQGATSAFDSSALSGTSAAQALLLFSLLGVVTAGLEARIVFRAFGQYIHVPPPLSYLLVTVCLYGIAALVAAHFMGLLRRHLSPLTASAILLASIAAGSFAIAIPLQVLPAPLVGAAYLVQYYYHAHLRDYVVFACGALVSLVWFLAHNLWFLHIEFADISLSTVCRGLVAAAALALLIPGTARGGRHPRLTGTLLVAQGLLTLFLEDRLFSHLHEEEEGLYPVYMVLITSAVGLVLARHLRARGRLGPWLTWAVQCIYTAKLSMVLLPTHNVVWPSLLLLLTATPSVMLYRRAGDAGLGSGGAAASGAIRMQDYLTGAGSKGVLPLAASDPLGRARPRDQLKPMRPWQGVAHVLAIVMAVAHARHMAHDALQWWSGITPLDGQLVGCLLLAIGAACLPIAYLHFPTTFVLRRMVVLILATGVLFLTLCPPLPSVATSLWQSSAAPPPEHLLDDVAIFGPGGDAAMLASFSYGWPTWFLMLTILLVLAAALEAVPIHRIVAARALFSVTAGAAAGMYLVAVYFPGEPTSLHALLILASVLSSTFLTFAQLPSAASPKYQPWLFAGIVALLPVTFLVHSSAARMQAPLKGAIWGRTGVMGDAWPSAAAGAGASAVLRREGVRTSILSLYCALFLAFALLLKLRVASLVRASLAPRSNKHLQTPSVTSASHGARAAASNPFAPHHRAVHRQSLGTLLATRQLSSSVASGGDWMPAVGNVATLLAFGLALVLNASFTGSSDASIFPLVPILLLLNQDVLLLKGFADRQRYFPLSLAVSLFLFVSAALKLYRAVVWSGGLGAAMVASASSDHGLSFLARNLGSLLLLAPTHVFFNRFLWDSSVRRAESLLLLLTPLCVPPLLLTDIGTVRTLAALGAVEGVVQYFASRNVRMAGMRYI